MLTEANKTLAVAGIKDGTVIDHITSGMALKIVDLLKLNQLEKQLTLGLNLPSKTTALKDIIKISNRVITEPEANQIAIFAPNATINIIKDFEVIQKYQVSLPATITAILKCPNPRCVTNHEKMSSFFYIKQRHPSAHLQCKYCRKTFTQANT